MCTSVEVCNRQRKYQIIIIIITKQSTPSALYMYNFAEKRSEPSPVVSLRS